MEDWEIVHKWEWFRRSQWLNNFRDTKLLLRDAVTSILRERRLADGLLLDCSCGLGFQAITFREAGLRVKAADRSPFAVSRARELAQSQAADIDFFVALWQELPCRTTDRFDAVFCDALCWLHGDEEMAAALRGVRGVLKPGGVLMFQGAPEGSSESDCRSDLEAWWSTLPSAWLSWRHREGAVACTSLSVGILSCDCVDWRVLYLVEEEDVVRLENVTLRESMRWHRSRFEQAALACGFRDLRTYAVREWSPGGRPLALNVATASS
jgi:SAM-dependent methyltransferase